MKTEELSIRSATNEPLGKGHFISLSRDLECSIYELKRAKKRLGDREGDSEIAVANHIGCKHSKGIG